METPAPVVHPHLLWRRMSEAQKQSAADAFWREPDNIEQQIEAMALLAHQLKARPRFVQGLPVERRAHYLAHFPNMPDPMAARLLVSYHLAHQRPMMGAFLDALGIKHDNGLISEGTEEAVKDASIEAGIKALASYPPEDVSLYFGTLVAQDPDTWKALEAHITA